MINPTKLKGIQFDRKLSEEIGTETVQRHLAKVKDANDVKEILGLTWQTNFTHSLDLIEELCESPIEKQVAYALMCGFYSVSPNFCHIPTHKAIQLWNGNTDLMDEVDRLFPGNGRYFVKMTSFSTNFWMIPNLWLSDKIRADIVITNAPYILNRIIDGKKTRLEDIKTLIIECDSFQYHGDRIAFRKDKIREREIVKLGYPVLRFSGSEIMANSAGIAQEIMDFMLDFVKKV